MLSGLAGESYENGDLASAQLVKSVTKYNHEEVLGLHTMRANPSDGALCKMARHTEYT